MIITRPIPAPNKRGFTLAELMVAMGITAIILTLLVSITGVALDGWRVSRNKVRASRQAKAVLDQLSRDFESMVVRSGNNFEWLYAESETSAPGPSGNESPNAARLIFFTAATDRYDGDIGGSRDKGGDVSAVGYRLLYGEPMEQMSDGPYSVFAIYRQLVNPDRAFEDMLSEENLKSAYSSFENDENESSNFVCENIYQMSVVFLIEYTEESGGRLETRQVRVPVLSAGGGQEAVNWFKMKGNGLQVQGDENPKYGRGRVVAVDISASVVTDGAVARLRQGTATDQYVNRNTYHYMKTVLLPQP